MNDGFDLLSVGGRNNARRRRSGGVSVGSQLRMNQREREREFFFFPRSKTRRQRPMEALTSHRTTQHVVNDMLPWQCEESVLPQGANGCHKGNHPKRNETKRNEIQRYTPSQQRSVSSHPPAMYGKRNHTTRRYDRPEGRVPRVARGIFALDCYRSFALVVIP